MSNVVPKSLYDELQAKLEKKSEELGELRVQLRREAGLNAAVMARDTLEDFKNNILISQGYLASEHSDVESIKVAYRTFLSDSTNRQSRDVNRRIANYPNFFRDVEEFVTRATEAYSKTSRVIHASSQAFRILHSFNDFLNVIKVIPTLSIEEETSVSLISYVVSYP